MTSILDEKVGKKSRKEGKQEAVGWGCMKQGLLKAWTIIHRFLNCHDHGELMKEKGENAL